MLSISRKSPLAPAERETHLSWTDEDNGLAVVHTSQPPMIARLRKHPRARLLATQRAGKVVIAEEYEIPVACLAILLKPRASPWGGMVQSGRAGRKIAGAGARGRVAGSDPPQGKQTSLPGVGPEGGRP